MSVNKRNNWWHSISIGHFLLWIQELGRYREGWLVITGPTVFRGKYCQIPWLSLVNSAVRRVKINKIPRLNWAVAVRLVNTDIALSFIVSTWEYNNSCFAKMWWKWLVTSQASILKRHTSYPDCRPTNIKAETNVYYHNRSERRSFYYICLHCTTLSH